MTKTNRLIGFVVGGLLFSLGHLIEMRFWAPSFGRSHQAWFVGDQQAAQFMFGWLFVTSLIAGWFRLSGFMIVVGAWVAMTAVIFTFRDGAGTLFPIALVIGGTLIAIACWPAAFAGKEVRNWMSRPELRQ
jgi:hypothetical protein